MTWANLDSRIREGSLSALILAENIGGIEGIDYDLSMMICADRINDICRSAVDDGPDGQQHGC